MTPPPLPFMAGPFLASSRLHLFSSSSKPFAVSVVASRRLFTTRHSIFPRSISHRRTTPRVSRPVYPAAGIQFRPLTSSRISRSPKMVAEDFEAVLKTKYPGKAHAKRVVELIRKKEADATGVLYLESRMTKLIEDNDSPEPFRYEYVSLRGLASANRVVDSVVSFTTSPVATLPTPTSHTISKPSSQPCSSLPSKKTTLSGPASLLVPTKPKSYTMSIT